MEDENIEKENIKNKKLDYINAEYGLSIIKKKGKLNTVQMFKYKEPFEILVCITSITHALIKKGIVTKKEIKEAVEIGAKEDNEKF